jgi:hypothetical protein
MPKQSKIILHAHRGRTDKPEVITITFDGVTLLGPEALEYWRKAVANFYGGARVLLEEEAAARPQIRSGVPIRR